VCLLIKISYDRTRILCVCCCSADYKARSIDEAQTLLKTRDQWVSAKRNAKKYSEHFRRDDLQQGLEQVGCTSSIRSL